MDKVKLIASSIPLILGIAGFLVLEFSKIEISKKILWGDINRRVMILGMATVAFYYETYLSLYMFIIMELIIGYVNERIADKRIKKRDEEIDFWYKKFLKILEERF